MKKSIKTMAFALAAAVLCTLLPGASLTARAEGTTYSLMYIGDEINDWRYVEGNTFGDNAYHRELYYLEQSLKDGDTIVVYPGAVSPGKELHLPNVRLANLTVYQNLTAVIFTGGVKDCYVLAGTNCAINGDVTNAYLYESTNCTFNNNVLEMTWYTGSEPTSNISCSGTVGHFQSINPSTDTKNFEAFDVPQNVLRIIDGTYQLTQYSPTPSDSYNQARQEADNQAAAPSTTQTAPSTTPSTSASADEYDDVPKTGESTLITWLLLASVLFFAGSYGFYRKAR